MKVTTYGLVLALSTLTAFVANCKSGSSTGAACESGACASRGTGGASTGPGGSSAATTSAGSSGTGGTSTCGNLGEACCSGTTCSGALSCRSGTCQNAPGNGTGTPCTKNSDCPNLICQPVGKGIAVCSTTCASASDCVPGWTCGAEPGQATNVCQCTSMPETCNGKDDDCNGVVDDEPAVDASCQKTQGALHHCTAGACACSATSCGGACVDLMTDTGHCGACGSACPWGGACQGGACSCPSGQTACSLGPNPDGGAPQLECVDTQTNLDNCGGCGMSCAGGTCSGGVCTQQVGLVYSNIPITGMALDTTSLYVSAFQIGQPGQIEKTVLAGGDKVLATGGTALVTGIAVDATSVYWINNDSGFIPIGSHVMRLPLGGGTPTTFANAPSGSTSFTSVTSDGTTVFVGWTDQTFQGNGGIGSIPIAGGAVTTLVSGKMKPVPMVLDAANVYWLDAMGAINKIPKAGGTVTTLATASQAFALAVDGTSVYWADAGAGTVMKVAIAGGAPTTLASGLASPTGVAVDATSVYWTNATTVMKAPLAGGAPVTLVSNLTQGMTLSRILVDAESVYYMNFGGEVYRRTPK